MAMFRKTVPFQYHFEKGVDVDGGFRGGIPRFYVVLVFYGQMCYNLIQAKLIGLVCNMGV